jgi:hypothetical protein
LRLGVVRKLFLAVAAAAFEAHNFGGGEACTGIKPAGEGGTARERGRFAGQIAENGLRDILSQVRVAVHLPERGGINKVDVPPNEFGESIFGAAAGKPPQQFRIGHHRILQLAPAGRRFAREKPQNPVHRSFRAVPGVSPDQHRARGRRLSEAE